MTDQSACCLRLLPAYTFISFPFLSTSINDGRTVSTILCLPPSSRFASLADMKLTNHGGGVGDGGKAAHNAEDGEEGHEEQAGHHLDFSVLIIPTTEQQAAETENRRVRQSVKFRGASILGIYRVMS